MVDNCFSQQETQSLKIDSTQVSLKPFPFSWSLYVGGTRFVGGNNYYEGFSGKNVGLHSDLKLNMYKNIYAVASASRISLDSDNPQITGFDGSTRFNRFALGIGYITPRVAESVPIRILTEGSYYTFTLNNRTGDNIFNDSGVAYGLKAGINIEIGKITDLQIAYYRDFHDLDIVSNGNTNFQNAQLGFITVGINWRIGSESVIEYLTDPEAKKRSKRLVEQRRQIRDEVDTKRRARLEALNRRLGGSQ